MVIRARPAPLPRIDWHAPQVETAVARTGYDRAHARSRDDVVSSGLSRKRNAVVLGDCGGHASELSCCGMDGRKCSEGRRRLLAILATITQAVISAKVGACRSSIAYWASGESLPGYQYRRALETHYGIPMDAWDNPATLEQVRVPEALSFAVAV